MQFLALSSFIAGILTVLTPCVLPLLPIILGKSISSNNKWRPVVIIVSLMLSITLFTILLKSISTFASIPPSVWTTISGVLVVGMGIITLFPKLWQVVTRTTKIEEKSQKLLEEGSSRWGLTGDIITGIALGPIFSSCSPTYAIIVATVLPTTFLLGLWYLFLYVLGLGLILLVIAIGGRSISSKLGWTANPKGWFRRGMAIIFIIIGLAILTGYDKKIQVLFPDPISAIDAKLISRDIERGDIETPLVPVVPATKTISTIPKPDLSVASPYASTELPAGLEWINSNPLTMAELKGKVVIIDFWTYSCINCLRTLPYLTAWNEKYKDQGLVIIGVHAPEFAFEREKKNVESAVKDHGITYPVVLDNDFKIWKSYENQFWPAKYFIDKTGKVRSTHFGEGAYDESEKIIQYLLSEGMEDASMIKTGTVEVTPVGKSGFNQNPETYLGLSRAENYTGTPGYNTNGEKTFTLASNLDKNEWSLGGNWNIEAERIISQKNSILQMNVSGRDVYLVLGGKLWATARVSLNGQNASGKDVVNGILTIDGQRLYHLVSEKTSFVEKTLKIEFDSGIEGYAFTFGG